MCSPLDDDTLADVLNVLLRFVRALRRLAATDADLPDEEKAAFDATEYYLATTLHAEARMAQSTGAPAVAARGPMALDIHAVLEGVRLEISELVEWLTTESMAGACESRLCCLPPSPPP